MEAYCFISFEQCIYRLTDPPFILGPAPPTSAIIRILIHIYFLYAYKYKVFFNRTKIFHTNFQNTLINGLE